MASDAESEGTPLAELVRQALLEAEQQLARARRGRDRGVHKARKALQRLRSLLQLLRPVAGKRARKVDRRIRDLRRRFAELRDASARFDLLQGLARSRQWAPEARNIAAVAARASVQLGRVWQHYPRDAEFWDDVERDLRALKVRLLQLPWSKVDAEALVDARARAWRRLEARMRADAGDCLHETRHAVRCALRRYASVCSLAQQMNGTPAPEAFARLARRCGREGDLWIAVLAVRAAATPRSTGRLRLADALDRDRIALCERNRRALDRLVRSMR